MANVRPGSWSWIFSKLALVLTVAVAVVIFSRFLSYVLVETISIRTFDNIAVSLLKTFLNETQFKTVVHNMKVAGSTSSKLKEIKEGTALDQRIRASAIETKSPVRDEESECAVCKYVMPPLVR